MTEPSSQHRIYLDNAATSYPKPECVYEAVDAYMRNNGAAFGRGSHTAGSDAAQIVAQCRNRLARILGASSASEIAYTFNCTDGLNLLLRGILSRGDRVVTTKLEHNSVLRPLRQLQRELELDVVYVGFDPQSGLVDKAALVDELTAVPTQLVVLNHASNVTGVIQPVKAISQAAHDAGALILLDAAQTAGHVPFSVTELNVDLLATAGHKGLLGPLGTGLIYVRSDLERRLVPVRCGGTGTQSESMDQPETMPSMFESGNLNTPGIAGLNASANWLLQQDLAQLHEQVSQHCSVLKDGLRAVNGITLHCDGSAAPNTGIVSFVIDGVDSRDAATILDQSFHVQCRAGLHCAPLVHETLATESNGGSLRLSPGVFTTDEHIAATVSAIDQLASSMAN